MNSLRSKIVVFLLMPIILLAIGYFSVSELVLKKGFVSHLENEALEKTGTMSARFKDAFLSDNRAELTNLVFGEKYSDQEIKYIIIYNGKGQIVADSEVDDQGVASLSDNGLHDSTAYYISVSDGENSPKATIYNVERPISAGLYKLGMLRVGYDFKDSREGYLVSLYWSFTLGIIVFLLVIFLSQRLSNVVVRPVEDLITAMRNYANGDFTSFAKVTSLDEIGDLAVTFNIMKSNLEENQKKLVREKKMVETKAAELESWQKTAVARELKMIELKNRIKELENNEDKIAKS